MPVNRTIYQGTGTRLLKQKLSPGDRNAPKGRKINLPIAASLLTCVFLFFMAIPVHAAVNHTVKQGDTLFYISKRYGTSVNLLMKENGLNSEMIYPGQVLRIPGGQTPSRSSALGYTTDDVYWLARAVYGEARGEPYIGQVAVAAVIINRVESPNFPKSIKEVIFEPQAFTAVTDGQIYLDPNDTAIRAAREALNGADPSAGALYYWNPEKATSKWIWSRTIIKRIGKHVFGI